MHEEQRQLDVPAIAATDALAIRERLAESETVVAATAEEPAEPLEALLDFYKAARVLEQNRIAADVRVSVGIGHRNANRIRLRIPPPPGPVPAEDVVVLLRTLPCHREVLAG